MSDPITGAREASARSWEMAPVVIAAYLAGVIKEYDRLRADLDEANAALEKGGSAPPGVDDLSALRLEVVRLTTERDVAQRALKIEMGIEANEIGEYCCGSEGPSDAVRVCLLEAGHVGGCVWSRDEMARALSRVRQLHVESSGFCEHCIVDASEGSMTLAGWPCATVRALEGDN